jgi:hypothetical protein
VGWRRAEGRRRAAGVEGRGCGAPKRWTMMEPPTSRMPILSSVCSLMLKKMTSRKAVAISCSGVT